MGATRIGCSDAAGLRVRSGRARFRYIVTACRARLAAAPQLWALSALCLSLISFSQMHALAFRASIVAGSVLILAAAVRHEADIRRAIADTAAADERRRIARDLHDGLAQDLAFIAAHGDRIAREAGEDHPLAIAARRALALSRGAIADLSASEAPSARAALRQVADELALRFGVFVDVEADAADLSREAREDVIRIVREAIVNAAKAGAHSIAVSLVRSGDRFVLRVRDDGAGIGSDDVKSRPGFGLRSMQERAASLGGRLVARPALARGTELEVMFP